MARQPNAGSFKKNDPRICKTGRPKLGKTLAAKFRDALSEPLSETEQGAYTMFDSIVDAIVKKALKGDLASADWLIARGYGKLIDRTENVNLNKTYDFSNVPIEERKKLLETMRLGTVANDSPDTL